MHAKVAQFRPRKPNRRPGVLTPAASARYAEASPEDRARADRFAAALKQELARLGLPPAASR